MEKEKILKLFQIVSLVVLLLSEILLSVIVLTINMLPGEYVAVLLLVLIAVALYVTLFMFLKIKFTIAQWRRIVSGILALVIGCGCLVVGKMGWDAYSFVSNVTGDVSGTRNTYVLVLNEDPAKTLEDTKNYTYGAVESYDVEHTQQMLAIVNEKTGNTIKLTYFQQPSVMVDALLAGDVDALVMNGASISLLVESEAYADLLSKVRLLYTLPFEEEEKDNTDRSDVTKHPFVLYISGSDTRSKKLVVSRSDVNILAVVNPKTKQILLINTPRDYYVPNPAGNGKLDKLTHCGNYGVTCSAEAMGALYAVDVDYYAKINFTGFEALIDAIDGITVVSDQSFSAVTGDYFQKGENTLNGQQALAFARERYNVSGGDNTRGKNQMKVIKAVVDKLSGSTTLITKYSDILKSLEGMFEISFSSDQISALVKMQLKDMSGWDVQSFAVTGTGAYGETYSAPGQELYVMHPNEDTVEFAQDLIQKVMKGEKLTADDVVMPKTEG